MNKRLISLLLSIVMIVAMLPMSVLTATADAATVITEVRATYEFVAPEYGAANYSPNFTYTITNDVPVELTNESTDWCLWYEDDWLYYRNKSFVNGTWCHDVNVSLTDTTNYQFATDAKLYINDVLWGEIYDSRCYVQSPPFIIDFVDGLELNFYQPGDIDLSYISIECTGDDLFNNVTGGTQPYAFTKTSGPDWINVSEDGIISGTPTTAQENEDLVVTVTDAVGAQKSVTIDVGETYINPADREVVSRVVGTITIPELYCGDDPDVCCTFTAETTEGTPAYLSASNSDFYVPDGSGGYNVYNDPLVAGTYAMDVNVKIDSENGGHTHMLDEEDLEVIINGQAAIDIDPTVRYDSSYDWVKIEGITVSHIFDNDTDATCNGCSYTREGCDHLYDNDCDADCNTCGATRTVTHSYDNACDDSCNLCGVTRVPSEHQYDNCFDTNCNECGAFREVEGHTYDNDCDTTCNKCNSARYVSHSFENHLDTSCGTCGYERELNYIQLGDTKLVNIDLPTKVVDFVFTPTVTAEYIFASQGFVDTYGSILTVSNATLASDDDGGLETNFSVTYELTAGTTYILQSKCYSTNTGSFTVTLTCVPGSANGIGDINGDAVIDVLDLAKLKKIIAGVNDGENEKCDLNDDGNISALDLAELKKMILNV